MFKKYKKSITLIIRISNATHENWNKYAGIKLEHFIKNQIKDFIKTPTKQNNVNFIYENIDSTKHFVVCDKKRKHVLLSTFFPCVDPKKGRNSFLSQDMNKSAFINKVNTAFKKTVYVPNLYIKQISDISNFQNLTFKLFRTIGYEIIFAGFDNKIFPYSNGKELIKERSKSSSKNRNNKALYISESEDAFYVHGKSDGANAGDTLLVYLALKTIEKQVSLTYLNKFPKWIGKEFRLRLNDADSVLIENITNKDQRIKIRHQSMFIKNLLKKYGCKSCFICNNNCEYMIIASHIERVSDINRNKTYGIDEKKQRVTSANNGLFLCSNCDKALEYCHIIFQGNKIVINQQISNNDSTIAYFKSILPSADLTKKAKYIKAHVKRCEPNH